MGNSRKRRGVALAAPDPTRELISLVVNLERSLKTNGWMDTIEAANFLRISVKALRNKTSNGQLPFYKLGRSNRYRKDELETVLLSQKRGKQWE